MSTDPAPIIDRDTDGSRGAGTATGIREAVRAAGPLLSLRDAEQLDMLADKNGSISTTHIALAGRGRGRPAGARNQRTREVRDYLLSRYAHPLETLAQYQSRPVDALAAELGCSKKEAGYLQVRAAAELAPYLEGKMPSAIDLTTNGDFNLLIPGVNITREEAALTMTGDFIPFAEFDDAERAPGDVSGEEEG